MSYLAYHEGAPPSGGGAFQSMTDALDPTPTIVPKQHFVETFSGDALDSIWRFKSISASNSGAMLDAVNGGYRQTTSTGFFDSSQIDFNDINHYDPAACRCIVSMRFGNVNDGGILGGCSLANMGGDSYAGEVDSDNTFINFNTSKFSTTTSVNTSVAIDTVFHRYDIEGKSASAAMHLDGVLEAVSTTNLPATAQQPSFYIIGEGGSAETGDINYLEIFNI